MFHRFVCCILCLIPIFMAEAADKPNIILILADDLGAHDLACYGSKFHKTPQLDRLAQGGVRFTAAYAACPVCSPTRAALMTGKAPARVGITDWLPGRSDRPDQKLKRPELKQQLALEETTLAEHLAAAGYETAIFGKWHLGGTGFSPLEQGFHKNIGGDQTGTPLSYFAPYQNGKAAMPGLEAAPEGEYLTDRMASEAEKFIAAKRERPFFLYLPFHAVHTPMKAPDALISKYPQNPRFGSQSNPIYAAMLESLDSAVGRIISKLEESGLREKTVVIFTSDNGGLATLEGPNTPATINSPLREGKGYLYEGGIRVPLIVSAPGRVPSGKLAAEPVITNDLFATCLNYAGIERPAVCDGVDLSSLLAGTGTLPERDLCWHYPHYSNQGGKPGGAIRSGEYKLVEFYENQRRELFHIARDASESRNIAEENPEITQRLAEKLEAWRKATGAHMPAPNPDYVPNPQNAEGTIIMSAKTAEVHGRMLRYEPLPHKNTLGFWVRAEDYASFEFTVSKPGRFELIAEQGCGGGNGGSLVEFAVGDQKLEMTVEETGGFQNFKQRSIGEMTFETPGRYTLTIKPKTKAKAAVMDIRSMTLKPLK